jgi:hypothetical protein
MGETRNANWILVGTYEGENVKDLDVATGTYPEITPSFLIHVKLYLNIKP